MGVSGTDAPFGAPARRPCLDAAPWPAGFSGHGPCCVCSPRGPRTHRLTACEDLQRLTRDRGVRGFGHPGVLEPGVHPWCMEKTRGLGESKSPALSNCAGVGALAPEPRNASVQRECGGLATSPHPLQRMPGHPRTPSPLQRMPGHPRAPSPLQRMPRRPLAPSAQTDARAPPHPICSDGRPGPPPRAESSALPFLSHHHAPCSLSICTRPAQSGMRASGGGGRAWRPRHVWPQRPHTPRAQGHRATPRASGVMPLSQDLKDKWRPQRSRDQCGHTCQARRRGPGGAGVPGQASAQGTWGLGWHSEGSPACT